MEESRYSSQLYKGDNKSVKLPQPMLHCDRVHNCHLKEVYSQPFILLRGGKIVLIILSYRILSKALESLRNLLFIVGSSNISQQLTLRIKDVNER